MLAEIFAILHTRFVSGLDESFNSRVIRAKTASQDAMTR